MPQDVNCVGTVAHHYTPSAPQCARPWGNGASAVERSTNFLQCDAPLLPPQTFGPLTPPTQSNDHPLGGFQHQAIHMVYCGTGWRLNAAAAGHCRIQVST